MSTIKYEVNYEKLISRLPALFAFINVDENGVTTIVKASNGEQGCYGKIIANIRYDKGDFNHTCSNGIILKISNGEHTYRELIDVYYKAIEDKSWGRDVNGFYEEPFLKFMERGIGLVKLNLDKGSVVKSECGVDSLEEFPLVPKQIYLGEVHTLYNKVLKLKKRISFWENGVDKTKIDKNEYDKVKKLYHSYNGDRLISKLNELMGLYEEISEEYLQYSLNTNLTLDFNLNINSTIKDLGIVVPYVTDWVKGKRYYDGDVVYYTDPNGYGLTWECKLPEDSLKDEFGRRYTNGFYVDFIEDIFFENGSTVNVRGNDIVLPKKWYPQSLSWVKRNIHYSCGECGRVYFENKPTKCVCGFDRFNSSKYVPTQDSKKKVSGVTNSKLKSLRRFTSYLNKNDLVEHPDNMKDWLWYYREGFINNHEAKYDFLGNLALIKNSKYNLNDLSIEPILGKYKPNNVLFDTDGKTVLNLAVWGDVITNITAKNGENGVGVLEIEYWLGAHLKAKIDENLIDGKKTYTVLKPFSVNIDGIRKDFFREDIIDEETYLKIGSNQKLCHERTWFIKTDDGGYKYFFKNFEIDTKSKFGESHGVKYNEKYIYHKGDISLEVIEDISVNSNGKTTLYKRGAVIDWSIYNTLTEDNKRKCKVAEHNIWTLVEQGLFKDYVLGKFDKVNGNLKGDNGRYFLYEKMEFDSENNLSEYKTLIGSSKLDVPFTLSNFETIVDINSVDIEDVPVIHYDYYNGVSYQPSVVDDVYIERGLTQAFEKHIKFSEIKTFEDLENYANGGFFTISKEDIDLG